MSHRHVTVDDKICNIPSAIIKPGQKIGLREKSRGLMAVADALKNSRQTVGWVQWDTANMTGTLVSVPERSEIPENIDMQLIVELYSR